MCKKLVSMFLVVVMFSFSLTAFAAPTTSDQTRNLLTSDIDNASKITYFPDGSKLITSKVIIKPQTNSSLSTNMYAASSSYVTTAGQQSYYVEADGQLKFIYYLWGDFQINPGVSATCTKAYHGFVCYDSNWSLFDYSDTFSNQGSSATAYGSYICKHYLLFITLKTTSDNLSVTGYSSGSFVTA